MVGRGRRRLRGWCRNGGSEFSRGEGGDSTSRGVAWSWRHNVELGRVNRKSSSDRELDESLDWTIPLCRLANGCSNACKQQLLLSYAITIPCRSHCYFCEETIPSSSSSSSYRLEFHIWHLFTSRSIRHEFLRRRAPPLFFLSCCEKLFRRNPSIPDDLYFITIFVDSLVFH